MEIEFDFSTYEPKPELSHYNYLVFIDPIDDGDILLIKCLEDLEIYSFWKLNKELQETDFIGECWNTDLDFKSRKVLLDTESIY